MERAKSYSFKSKAPRPNTIAREIRNGRRWKAVSKLKRSMNPVCEPCASQGRTTAATEVHHRIPIEQAPELAYTLENLVSVCSTCHGAIEPKAGDGGGHVISQS
ncbi:MAG TPA: HNH endonuclease signature motif containing protein [Planctomycetota bacterium]|nr:HNH endonuclease signature motif containing protein [Planctomycetota bacterium]